MRGVGYALFFIGLVAGGLTTLFAPGSDIIAIFGLLMIGGATLLVISGITRIAKGEVRLRPIMAMRKAALLFVIIVGLKVVFELWFPSLKFDLANAVISSAVFALAFGFHATAYRKKI